MWNVLFSGDPEQISALTERAHQLHLSDSELRPLVAAAENAAHNGPSAFEWDEHGQAVLTVGDQRYLSGHFSTPSLAELKQQLEPQLETPDRKLQFSVLRGNHILTSITALEHLADGHTLFQLASQFNCLESPSDYLVPVIDYFYDRTQGPLGALPAFAGTLQRHYAAPDGQGGYFIQSGHHQINLLADAAPADLLPVDSGYLFPQDIPDPAALLVHLENNLNLIRIGLHTYQEVITAESWVRPMIAQVMSSTLAAGRYSAIDTDTNPWPALMGCLLKATYLGTILGAAVAHQSVAVLTAIGGGVFGNPHPLIWQALCQAMTEAEPWLKQPLHLVLNGRGLDIPDEELKTAVQARNGYFVEL